MMKKVLTTLAKLVVSGGILYFLFSGMDLAAFWETVKSVSPFAVIFVALLYIFIQAVSAHRMSLILKKDCFVPYLKLLSIYFVGMFFNNFLPTMVGGDLIKGFYLYRETGKGGVSIASIFMDRYSGFSALIFITAVALIPGYALIKGTVLPGFFVLLIGGYIGASLVIWVGPLHSWAMNILAKIHFYGINKKIDTFYNVLMSYKSHRDILVKIFLISLVVQTGVNIGYYVLSRGLGIDVGLAYFFLFIPLSTVVSMLPVSVAGLGIREGAFVYLFTRVGASKEEAITLSLMWFAIMVVVSIIGGVEFLRMGGKKGGLTDSPLEVG
ncbi:MAG: lysylphosphatidylglycerol synthase transmembrane domain-containing protein [Thermodesulfobacteriota bacterium]